MEAPTEIQLHSLTQKDIKEYIQLLTPLVAGGVNPDVAEVANKKMIELINKAKPYEKSVIHKP